jgi:hypothetical protein
MQNNTVVDRPSVGGDDKNRRTATKTKDDIE